MDNFDSLVDSIKADAELRKQSKPKKLYRYPLMLRYELWTEVAQLAHKSGYDESTMTEFMNMIIAIGLKEFKKS